VSDEQIENSAGADAPATSAAPRLGQYLDWLDAHRRVQLWAGIAIIVLGAVAAYSQLLMVPLHLDEQETVDAILGGESSSVGALRSGATLSIALDQRLGNSDAFAFRLSSLVFHILGGLLLFGIVWRLLQERNRTPGWAVVAGVLFVVHPATTQTVNSLMSRGMLIASTGVFASLLCYLFATSRRRDEPSYALLVVSLILAAIAWAAHPVAIVVPVLVLLLDAIRRRVPGIPMYGAYWGLAGVLAIMQGSGALGSEVESFSWSSTSYAFAALGRVVAPFDLLVHYGPDAAETSTLIWSALAVIGLALLPFARVLGAGILWIVTCVLGYGLLSAPDAFDESMAYLCVPAVALLLAWGVAAAPGFPGRAIATAAVALITLAAIAGTSTRTNVWRSEAGLWMEAQDACPDCFAPNLRLGRLHLEEAERLLRDEAGGMSPEARQEEIAGHLNYAVEFLGKADASRDTNPTSVLAYARALGLQGERDKTQATLRAALDRYPDDPEVLVALGDWYASVARTSGDDEASAQAEMLYAAALSDSAAPVRSVRFIAQSRLRRGDALGALRVIQNVPSVERSNNLVQLAEAAQVQMRTQQAAMEVWRQASGDSRSAAVADSVKARTLYLQGHTGLTEFVASDALRRDPSNLESWYTLGLASFEQGTFAQFVDRYADGPVRATGNEAWRGLARTFASSNRWDGARAALEQAFPGEPFEVLMELADVALSLQQVQQAAALLQRAADQAPDSPDPWLRLAELALDAGQSGVARGFIEEAANRGAPDILLQPLRERAGGTELDDRGLQRRTIVQ